jgi:hypothetical protein
VSLYFFRRSSGKNSLGGTWSGEVGSVRTSRRGNSWLGLFVWLRLSSASLNLLQSGDTHSACNGSYATAASLGSALRRGDRSAFHLGRDV